MQRKWRRRWQRLSALAVPVVMGGMLWLSTCVYANPGGGQVSGGSAVISTAGSVMDIVQSSNKAVINWQTFSIDRGETVNVYQPGSSSVLLNRVIGSDASNIYGTLNANGHIYLVNPNGIFFNSTSQINVGGLVASTLNIKDADFLDGRYTFSGSGGRVVNQGAISAGQEAVLLGSAVDNQGLIAAKVTGLAAGSQVSLDFNGDALLSLTVDTGAAGGSVNNSGTVTATDGLVVMSAGTKQALLHTVVNNSGVVSAARLTSDNGIIRLEGDTITNTGTLVANGSEGRTGGTVTLDGSTITLGRQSVIRADGGAGGGSITVGGWQADSLSSDTGSLVSASALQSGNGGSISLIARTHTAGGTLAATGAGSGNGGRIETSGDKLTLSQTSVQVQGGNSGSAGAWLLDPYDFTIDSTAAAAITGALNGGANVTVQTNASGASATTPSDTLSSSTSGTNGDILVNAAMNWTSGNLTLDADRDVRVNATLNGYGLAVLTHNNGKFFVADGSTVGLANSFSLNGNSYTLVTDLSQINTYNDRYALNQNFSGVSSPFFAGNDFRGSLEGLGHTISNLTLNDPSGSNVGLFYGISGSGGSVSNLHIEGASVSGGSTVGILAGANYGEIYHVGVSGSVTGSNSVGGLVGYNGGTINASHNSASVSGSLTDSGNVGGLVGFNTGAISQSYNSGSVSGKAYIGGLVGLSNGGSIGDSYNNGSVSGYSYIGGLVGKNAAFNTVSQSYNSGSVSGDNTVGGLAGSNQEGTVENSYNSGSVSANSWYDGKIGWNSGGTASNLYSSGSVNGGASTAATTSYSTSFYKDTLGWTADAFAPGSVWYMIDGKTMPLLRWEYGTDITNAHQVQLVNMDLTAQYRLVNDIDLGGLIPSGQWSSAGFAPLGGVDAALTGSLDGGGHTISNLTINTSGNKVGLFGKIGTSGSVANLTLSNVNVTGDGTVGALAGYNSGAISQVRVSSGSVSGTDEVGGLVGYSDGSGTISASYNQGTVSGEMDVGGLVGFNEGAVSASYNTGTVSGGSYVGGLFGYNEGAVSASYNEGSVSGTGNYVGGLVGFTYDASVISASYNQGSVSGGGTGNYVGGLVGKNYGTIEMAYNSGSVTGGSYVGGVAGWNTGTIDNSHNVGTVGSPSGYVVGGVVGSNEGAVSASYNTGAVSGGFYVGGLVGYADITSSISASYNQGSVSGTANNVGGLVGENDGSIEMAYNSGSVSGGSYVGGVAGDNYGRISKAFNRGSVTGVEHVGGLAGYMGDYYGGSVTITESYNSGNVSGGTDVGGLVGWGDTGGSVGDSYNTGAVVGTQSVGGLAGKNDGSIDRSYNGGSVSGGTDVGGLVGRNNAAVSYSYWNSEQSGSSGIGGGTGTDTGNVGLTTAQMTGGTAGYNGFDFAGGTGVWYQEAAINGGLPILRHSPFVVTVAGATGGTINYGDSTPAIGNPSYDNFWPGDTADNLNVSAGVIGGSTSASGHLNAGTYQVGVGGSYTSVRGGNQPYIFINEGTVIVNPTPGGSSGTPGGTIAATDQFRAATQQGSWQTNSSQSNTPANGAGLAAGPVVSLVQLQEGNVRTATVLNLPGADAAAGGGVRAGGSDITLSLAPFAAGSAVLTPAAQTSLQQVVTLVAANPSLTIVITGYAYDGETADAAALARQRAQTAAEQLASQGVAAGRVIQQAIVVQQPPAPGGQLRQVEIHVQST